MNQQQRNAKRKSREDRTSKKTTWFCAGCRERHLIGQKCPTPRLFARTNRLTK